MIIRELEGGFPKDTHDSEPNIILYVWSLIKRKAVSNLIRTSEAVRNSNSSKNLELRVVGDGDRKEGLLDFSSEMSIHDRVTFTGHISEKGHLLAESSRADVFVHHSHEEGSPRIIIEAMSPSLPMIATDVGEVCDQLGEDDALIVEPESTEVLTSAITKVLNDSVLRQMFIKNGQSPFEEVRSSSGADQHISIVKSVLS